MNITDIFVKRPVLAICVNLLVFIAGIQAIQNLIVRQYPRSDVAVVTVKTVYVGTNAELVRGFITTPLEKAIASADGIDYLESSSVQGLSTITAHLRLNFNVNDALTQIQSKVTEVRNDLPREAEVPTINVESADNRFASMYLSFYSKDLDQNQITDYLTRVVQPKLSSLKGVQKADILGARKFAMRIWLKPEKLAALQISPSDVNQALQSNNFLSAIGATKGSMVSVNLIANTDLKTKAEFENLIVRRDSNTLIRIKDIADVSLGAENYDEDVKFSGETATFMGVWVLPNANSIDVIKSVRDILPQIEANVPSGMKVGIPYDATEYIRDAIDEVLHTLIETIIIVFCVIFIFIGSLRSVIVPMIAIPLSLIGATAIMLALGFTINLLTLLAIVLAVGLVVDDAIVMLENVERYVEEGEHPVKAAIKAARELTGPIIAMTITLAAVYAPIGFQGGLTGTLFKEFALTLSGAVFISGFVALTLSPMMSSKLVKAQNKKTKLKEIVDKNFALLRAFYEKALRLSIVYRYGIITLLIFFGILVIPFYLFSMKELAPREDQGVVFGIVQTDPNATLDQTVLFTKEVNKIFESFPEHAKTFQLTNPTFGFSGMLTKPWSQREKTTMQLESEVWGKMSSIAGIRVIITTPPPLPGGSDFPVEFVISSTDEPEKINGYAGQLVGKAFESGLFMFADTDLKYDLSQSEIVFDHDMVSLLGINLQKVGQDIGILTGGNYVNRFNIQGRSYKVIPQAERTQRLNPDQLETKYVSGPNGTLVPLSTFATIRNKVEVRSLNRFQQLNSAKIQGAVPPGVSIDQALSVLETEAQKILPQGYVLDYAGESRQLRKEQSSLTTTLILSIVLIFLVLASQFESFRDPFIILLGSVPLALAGSLAFVFLDATTLNIYSQVGLVTLVGLIAKNGILIVEFANKLQEEGLDKFEAVIQASLTRLRPILMTSIATVVGHFPLIMASGAGAGSRNSIGIVLVTGMIIGTVFTLFFVPSLYTFVARKREHQKRDGEIKEVPVHQVSINGNRLTSDEKRRPLSSAVAG
jgi:multidrug efflux pump